MSLKADLERMIRTGDINDPQTEARDDIPTMPHPAHETVMALYARQGFGDPTEHLPHYLRQSRNAKGQFTKDDD